MKLQDIIGGTLLVIAVVAFIVLGVCGYLGNPTDITKSQTWAICFPDESRALSQQEMIRQQAKLIEQQAEMIRLKKLELEKK